MLWTSESILEKTGRKLRAQTGDLLQICSRTLEDWRHHVV